MTDRTAEIVIAGAARTPIGAFQGELAPLAAPELGGAAIAGAIEEQTTATSEISRNVREAAERTRLVVEAMSTLQATASVAKASAGQIRDASEGIDDINGQVRSRIDAFLRKVAAA